MRIPVAREGYPFILAAVVVTALIWFLSSGWLFSIALLATVFVISFFRDPERDIPGDPDSIVSPADGKVIKVERLREERLLKDEALKVSIFMNIFDVHVNRTPVSGRVVNIIYNPGRFFSANLDKASFENEQNALLVEEARGRLVLNQIAGLVARRIVCRIREGTELRKGERIGMVMFGSRVDLYLPLNTNVIVKVGDRVKAGSSVLGYW
jgi:phosphatidylserine decarboxylase